MKLEKIFKDAKHSQEKKTKYIIGLFIGIFIICFYLAFGFCSVLYYDRWMLVGTLFMGIALDLVLYEGVLNGLICLLYVMKGKNKKYIKSYVKVFSFRNYRMCF